MLMLTHPVKLRGSRFGETKQVDNIARLFDSTTKLSFQGTEEHCRVVIGSTMERDVEHGIVAGKLKLSGYENIHLSCFRHAEQRVQRGSEEIFRRLRCGECERD